MNSTRKYWIIKGSKSFFDIELKKLFPNYLSSELSNFPQMVRNYDEYSKRFLLESERKLEKEPFNRTNFLIIKNHDYHSIVSTAHDRLSGLIEDLTTNDSQILVHNPTRLLEDYLDIQLKQNKIELEKITQVYEMIREPKQFKEKMHSISCRIIGQENALFEISKSMWYLTHVTRKKPFVIMLYGSSSIGKTEMVREISAKFFNDKDFEKHLSMFKNDRAQYFLFGDDPNRTSIGFELLERESNLIFLDEFDKLPDFFHSVFYTLFDNLKFSDSTYTVDISGLLIFLTSNYTSLEEMKTHLGLPIFYRIDKFVHFKDFDTKTILDVTAREILNHVEDSKGTLNESELYNKVSCRIQTEGENARTIKNIVQQEVENLLFETISDYKEEY